MLLGEGKTDDQTNEQIEQSSMNALKQLFLFANAKSNKLFEQTSVFYDVNLWATRNSRSEVHFYLNRTKRKMQQRIDNEPVFVRVGTLGLFIQTDYY